MHKRPGGTKVRCLSTQIVRDPSRPAVVRARAARAAGRQGSWNRASAETLSRALSDQERLVRLASLEALAEMQGDVEPAQRGATAPPAPVTGD